MPTVANGINFVWNLRQAHGENLERELRRSLLPKRQVIGLKRKDPLEPDLQQSHLRPFLMCALHPLVTLPAWTLNLKT